MSDLQNRLEYIEETAKRIRKEGPLATFDDVSTLSELVLYLAIIVRKHLETNER